MSHLFQPLQIRSVQLKNRVAVSPMCQYSSVDGFANDWHLVHLGSRAVGGAALVFTEAAAVSPEGRITPYDLGIYNDEHVDFLQRIVSFIQEQGAVAGIQLAHAGRKASHQRPWEGGKAMKHDEGSWTTVAPSSIPYREVEPIPQQLDNAGISKVVNDFKQAAIRALQAGFQIIEIHAAHGYLLHEFLSPLSNQRNDAYGGSFENRTRILLEVVEAVRSAWKESLPLFVRISATDWVDGGWSAQDSVMLSKLLKENGVDLVDCSSGGNSPAQQIPVAPLYQLQFAEMIKKETGILTGAVGLITKASEAEYIISEGSADLVLLARQFLRDPHFALRAAFELDEKPEWPSQYERAKGF